MKPDLMRGNIGCSMWKHDSVYICEATARFITETEHAACFRVKRHSVGPCCRSAEVGDQVTLGPADLYCFAGISCSTMSLRYLISLFLYRLDLTFTPIKNDWPPCRPHVTNFSRSNPCSRWRCQLELIGERSFPRFLKHRDFAGLGYRLLFWS